MIEKDPADFGEQVLDTANKAQEERELVTIGLLMRIYDIQLALLKHFDEDLAKEIYEEHGSGGNFNPPMFIPQFSGDSDGASS